MTVPESDLMRVIRQLQAVIAADQITPPVRVSSLPPPLPWIERAYDDPAALFRIDDGDRDQLSDQRR